jgi:hypothetical protein
MPRFNETQPAQRRRQLAENTISTESASHSAASLWVDKNRTRSVASPPNPNPYLLMRLATDLVRLLSTPSLC